MWRNNYEIPGTEELQLHHLDRAMAWLGEALEAKEQADATPFAPRCTKDRIEESLFARRRDLFSQMELVFSDTTSIGFEGDGAGPSASTVTAKPQSGFHPHNSVLKLAVRGD